jgi:hypothetical protein
VLARRLRKLQVAISRRRNRVSKQNPHGQVQLVRHTAAAIDGKRPQTSEFCRKQQVGAWTENNIAQSPAISPEDGSEIILIKREAPDVSSIRIVVRDRGVKFQLGRYLQLQLSPTACRIEAANRGKRRSGQCCVPSTLRPAALGGTQTSADVSRL